MSHFPGRPASALVVVDAQNGVLAEVYQREQVLERIADLVARARERGTPVVWVQHSSDELPKGSDVWRLVPELAPVGGEPVVHKRHGDSFEATDLEEQLAGLGVGRLVVAGAQTDACVRSTIHGGFTRGYDVVLVSDAHTTEDLSPWGAPPPEQVVAHTNLYWGFQTGPGRTADVLAAADVDLG